MNVATRMAGLLSLALLCTTGCGDKEYEADMKKICNAMELSGAKDVDPSERVMKMVNWLQSEIKGKKAMKLMQSMATMTPASRASKLRSEARKAGLDHCPFADEN